MNGEHIFKLMTLKLSGLISAEEEVWLDDLIKNDPAVQAQWTELLNAYNPKDIDSRFARYDEKPWKTFFKEAAVFNFRHARAAAGLVGLIIGSLIIWLSPKASAEREQNGLIVLTLANGETIQLSGKPDTVTVAGTRIANSGKSMTYNTDGQTPTGMNSLTVPTGMDYKINLPDGSEIWMNSATTLNFPFRFTGNTREIKITGEAYLKIAPDASRPFIVQAGSATVEVLGTEFNVNTYAAVKVSLIEGAVRVKTGRQVLQLAPGQEAIQQNADTLVTHSFETEEVLGWRKGIYYFNNASLKEITEVLPRWFGITVVMDRADVGGDLFSGLVNRNKPIRTFLENLKSTTAVDYYFDKDGVLHFK